MPNKLSRIWQELKRRNVLRTLAVYAGTAFVILEAADILFSRWNLPEWAFDLVFYLLILGAFITIIASWIFDITPGGIEKTQSLMEDQTGKKGKNSAGWRIATYVSIVVIIALVIVNLFGIKGTDAFGKNFMNTLLVLPFDNYSSSPDQDYFCDGMTEEVITDLSKIHDILVISRNTAMSFKGTDKTTGEIARETSVRYVLEGSVRKDGNNVRITAQLIDAVKDTHLWAENYTGTLDDIFDIQVKVSRSIANAMRIKLSPEESGSLSKQPVTNMEVYEYYLKAQQEIYRWSEEGLDRAIQYLERGLQIGGDNLLLYSAMGNAYFQYWNYGFRLDDFYLEQARDCAERIFQLEPGSYHGRIILGLLQSFNNPQEAIREFELVLRDDPLNEDALLWLCINKVHLGLIDSSDPLIALLARKDPLNSLVLVFPGLSYYYRGELELARESLERAYQSDMNASPLLWHYGKILAACGLKDQAVLMLDQCYRNESSGILGLAQLYSLALQQKKQDVLKLISPKTEHWARKDWMVSLWLAECLSLIGESEKACEYLEQSVKLGGINYPYLSEYSVFLNNIRNEKRFIMLMEQVQIEWQKIKT